MIRKTDLNLFALEPAHLPRSSRADAAKSASDDFDRLMSDAVGRQSVVSTDRRQQTSDEDGAIKAEVGDRSADQAVKESEEDRDAPTSEGQSADGASRVSGTTPVPETEYASETTHDTETPHDTTASEFTGEATAPSNLEAIASAEVDAGAAPKTSGVLAPVTEGEASSSESKAPAKPAGPGGLWQTRAMPESSEGRVVPTDDKAQVDVTGKERVKEIPVGQSSISDPSKPAESDIEHQAISSNTSTYVKHGLNTGSTSENGATSISSASPATGTSPGQTDAFSGNGSEAQSGSQDRSTSMQSPDPLREGKDSNSDAKTETPTFVTGQGSATSPQSSVSLDPSLGEIESVREHGQTMGKAEAQPGGSTTHTNTAGARSETGTPFHEADTTRVGDQAVRALRSVVSQRGGSVTLRLTPAELGAMRVRIEMNANVVSARFEVTSEVAREALQKQIGSLKSALESHGLKVDQLQIQNPSAFPGQESQAEADVPDDGRSRGRFDEPSAHDAPDDQKQDGTSRRNAFEQELMDLIA